MESLGGGSVTFFKFKAIGDTVDGIFDSLEWDRQGKYGLESNIRVVDEKGGTISARLSTSLVGTFKKAEKRLIPGKSRVVIKYLGEQRSKKDPSKTYKAYDVQAENLLPANAAANIAGAAATFSDPNPADVGDTSFNPSDLK